jgi:hypothetical protein
VLYQNPQALNDSEFPSSTSPLVFPVCDGSLTLAVTNGTNHGCSGEVAFSAVKGWDPVTGLGTPNYPKLLEVFLALP